LCSGLAVWCHAVSSSGRRIVGRGLHATNAAVPRQKPRSVSGATGVRSATSTAISDFTLNLARGNTMFPEGKTLKIFLSTKSLLYNNFLFNCWQNYLITNMKFNILDTKLPADFWKFLHLFLGKVIKHRTYFLLFLSDPSNDTHAQ
jgi:hypothetical protein